VFTRWIKPHQSAIVCDFGTRYLSNTCSAFFGVAGERWARHSGSILSLWNPRLSARIVPLDRFGPDDAAMRLTTTPAPEISSPNGNLQTTGGKTSKTAKSGLLAVDRPPFWPRALAEAAHVRFIRCLAYSPLFPHGDISDGTGGDRRDGCRLVFLQVTGASEFSQLTVAIWLSACRQERLLAAGPATVPRYEL
jgi:hypothetical protein